jgi:cholesterol transport system auxiliary component
VRGVRQGAACPAGALAVVFAFMLAGCSGLFHSSNPASQVYVLRAANHPRSEPAHASASVYVGRPIAGPGLESDHILLVQSDHRMSYFVASRWPAALPAVVEALTVDALRASGAWSTVQDSASAFSSDYLLQVVIRRFEADYSMTSGAGGSAQAPEVHVVLDCTLGRRAGRQIIDSFVAEGSAAASANRLGDVVAAFEDASNKALDELAARTAEAVKTSQKVETPVPSMTR